MIQFKHGDGEKYILRGAGILVVSWMVWMLTTTIQTRYNKPADNLKGERNRRRNHELRTSKTVVTFRSLLQPV